MDLIDTKVNRIFSILLNNIEGTNEEVLKQVSVYLSKSLDDNIEFNIDYKESQYYGNKYNYVLSLKDGRRIFFSNDCEKFGFMVLSLDVTNEVIMSTIISQRVLGDLSTVSVYGSVRDLKSGMYVVTFRPNNIYNNNLKFGTINYYTNDEIDWVYNVIDIENIYTDFDLIAKENSIYPFAEKSFFEVKYNDEILMDSFYGYVSDVITRIDLLYDNVRNVKINKLVKTK